MRVLCQTMINITLGERGKLKETTYSNRDSRIGKVTPLFIETAVTSGGPPPSTVEVVGLGLFSILSSDVVSSLVTDDMDIESVLVESAMAYPTINNTLLLNNTW